MPFEITRRRPGDVERHYRATPPLAIEAARLPGQLAAARIEAASYATHVALTHTAMLSALEGRLIQQAPLAEARMKALVDSYAGFCCQEIALLAYR